MCRFVGSVPDILGLVRPSFRPKSGLRSKISGRILKSVRALLAQPTGCVSKTKNGPTNNEADCAGPPRAIDRRGPCKTIVFSYGVGTVLLAGFLYRAVLPPLVLEGLLKDQDEKILLR